MGTAGHTAPVVEALSDLSTSVCRSRRVFSLHLSNTRVQTSSNCIVKGRKIRKAVEVSGKVIACKVPLPVLFVCSRANFADLRSIFLRLLAKPINALRYIFPAGLIRPEISRIRTGQFAHQINNLSGQKFTRSATLPAEAAKPRKTIPNSQKPSQNKLATRPPQRSVSLLPA